MEKNLNKNISVWRGDSTPPTNYHLWIKSDNLIYIYKDNKWQEITGINQMKYLTNVYQTHQPYNTFDERVVLNYIESGYPIIKDFPTISYDKSNGIFKQGLLDKQSYLNILPIFNIGPVNSNQVGDNAALDASKVTNISLLHYETTDNCSTILQSVNKQDYTVQLLLRDGKIYIRRINNKNNTTSEFRQCLPTGLKYEGDKHGFRFVYFGENLDNFSEDTFIEIPAFDNNSNPEFGLIKKEYKQKIDNNFEFINNIIIKKFSELTFKSTPNIIEKGISTNVELSWNFKLDDEEKTPEIMQLKDNSNNVLESNKKSYTDNISNTKIYKLVVKYNSVDLEKTLTISAYYPMYFGEGESTFDKNSIIITSNKRPIASNPSGNINITFTGGKYLWLCIPNEMNINKITSNGFAVPMEQPINQTINESYKCYRSTDTINKGTVSFTIS